MAKRVCGVEGCGKKHVAKGLCTNHYGIMKRTSPRRLPVCVDCNVDISNRGPAARRCVGCAKLQSAKTRRDIYQHHLSLREPRRCPDCGSDISQRARNARRCSSCAVKWQRQYDTARRPERWCKVCGDSLRGIGVTGDRCRRVECRICEVDTCTKPIFSRGYCDLHNKRRSAGIPLNAPIHVRYKNRKCQVRGCGNKHKGVWVLSTPSRAFQKWNAFRAAAQR